VTCPLCAIDFDEAICPPSCPMSHGCAMVRCPRCGYEFVEDGAIAALFRRLFKRSERNAASTR
jgi:hypothetical protein